MRGQRRGGNRDPSTTRVDSLRESTRSAQDDSFFRSVGLTRLDRADFRSAYFLVRLAFETHAVPEFEVQQAPDAVVVIAMAGAVLVEEALNCLAAEVSAIETARFEEHGTDRFEARAGEPAAPWCWETELGTVDDFVRQNVFDCLFQDRFPGEAF